MNGSELKLSEKWDDIADTVGGDDDLYKRIISLNKRYYGKIIDIACGDGRLLKKLKNDFPEAEYHGLDISPRLCEMAKLNNPSIKIVEGNAESTGFADEEFDFVFITEMLAHSNNPDKILLEAKRILKPNGYFIITVPNRDWLRYDFYEKMMKPLPGGTHYFRFQEMEKLLRENGFEIIKYRGSDNLYYYAPYHRYEQILAFFFPFLHKKMKRLLLNCVKV